MPEVRRQAPFSTKVIEKWVNDYAREEGVAVNRLQRWIWFMVILAVLDRVRDEEGDPLFLLKGGAAMELRLGLEARATKDIDTVFRESMESMLERLDEALQEGWGDFSFERTRPEAIKDTRSLRLSIKLSYRGKRWGTVPLEVAPAEGRSGEDVETLDAIGIDQFGLDGPERVPCLGISYQIAQKIHACTAPPVEGKDVNPRFHDPMDLILLRDLVADDGWPAVRAACIDTFETRAVHAWPPELTVYASWPAAFAALAEDQGFEPPDVEEAAAQVREMIARIDAATE
ncbi:MAG: nucleotidyl transferase AbiEii/AbiGii toxin family protein [Gaiellales bacterium]